MNLLNELNKIINDLPFSNRLHNHFQNHFYNHSNRHQTKRDDMAHFCEHDGICISFTQARSTWHALAPCALKPWWLFLNPSRLKMTQLNPLRKQVLRNK